MTNFDIKKLKRENLKRIMREHNIGPTELGRLIGRPQPAISRYTSAKSKGGVGDIIIKEICKALKIDESEFVRPLADELRAIPVTDYAYATNDPLIAAACRMLEKIYTKSEKHNGSPYYVNRNSTHNQTSHYPNDNFKYLRCFIFYLL